ncbi:uncharacterized protein LOC106778447 [Vigna radiata var. radiata]|uniref:Uncharacterized protein LOC106778447 n=1 Tax=Vigna radiata var. radiata TaxID=3916 RepID=A0A1S3VU33_VIGRR|nr:uncharacterized protein LOC106778447 [Vigna radiata var. radiata]
MVITRNTEEQQSTKELIKDMQAQMQAQLLEMQRKHKEEIAALRAERAHLASTTQRNHNRENDHEASRNQQPSHHTNPNDRVKREANSMITPTILLPFTTAIMQTPLPEKAPPVLEKYDGSTDPDDHLRIFVNTMAFYTDSDPVMCRAFSLSLKGEALAWYNTLPPNTVDCFATVEALFRNQYAFNRVQELMPIDLINTKQEKEETLKAFMKRYIKTSRRVKGINHNFIINNLHSCLKAGFVAENLYAKPPKTMDELQKRIAKFIRMEDMRNSIKRQQQEASASGNKKKGKR